MSKCKPTLYSSRMCALSTKGCNMEHNIEEEILFLDRKLYTYKAIVTKIVDGDTVDLDIDLGLGMWSKSTRIRFLNINTPEVRGKEREAGLAAKRFVEDIIPIGCSVYITTVKDKRGKYGRLLGTIYTDKGANINSLLLDEGHAKFVKY